MSSNNTEQPNNHGTSHIIQKQPQRSPDEKHPLGYGRSVYLWSFMVAMLLFSVGGMFSIYEGIHKYSSSEPLHNIAWGAGILIFSK